MTDYTSLSADIRYVIAGLIFFASLMQLGICLYKYVLWKNVRYCIREGIIYSIIFMLAVYVKGASKYETVEYEVKIPWCFLAAGAVAAMVRVVINLEKEYIESRKRLSSTSIKQAFDNLNSGICFADAGGRIVLINYLMCDVIYSVLGRYPQTLSDLEATMRVGKKRGSEQVDSQYENRKATILRLPDESVWSFRSVPVKMEEFQGYRQITAFNITEISGINEKLAVENGNLKVTNEKLRIMLEHLADHIREQETLELKMRIHNDIGASLISIANIMNHDVLDVVSGDCGRDLDEQLKLLKNAVSYFADHGGAKSNSLSDVIKQAEKMNVSVKVIGDMCDDEIYRHIISFAVKESVTNCVNHAQGDEVTIRFTGQEENGRYSLVMRITNNGIAPKDNITEGGGLSSLRKAVEAAGGQMRICYKPEFALIISL